MTYFLEIMLLLVIVPIGVFFLVRKKSPKDAFEEAEKVLGVAITASEYCDAKGISEEALMAMIGKREIMAYESMGMLFVQGTDVH
ncbi:hypothetical protein A9Q81_13070 [Gammaproteobacteria bacterium 42_54_T18]|nr:hypothetical protein A9Q81_13070 [Gammaproteobacteria bacterium 42_54_T18]